MVESTLAFREGTTSANKVAAQFLHHESDGDRYNWVISRLSGEATFLASGQHEASRATHSPASGFLIPASPRGIAGEGHLLWETALMTAFPFSG